VGLLTWKRVIVVGLSIVALAAATSTLPMARALVALFLLLLGTQRLRGVPSRAARPWRLVVIGGTLALVSAGVRMAHAAVAGVGYPYPSPADVLAYAAYLCLIGAAISFVRSRTQERYQSDLVDSIVVAALASVLLYSLVLGDYLLDDSVPVLDRVGNALYSLLTIVMVGAVARVSFGPGVRNGAYYLFATSAFLIVINDVLLLLDTVGRPHVLMLARIVAPAAFVFGAASFVHPGAFVLTERPVFREEQLGIRRVAVLLVALGAGPLIVQLEPVKNEPVHVIVVSCLWIVIASAVLYRMVLLVNDRDVATRQERALRDLAGHLTGLQSREAVTVACLKTGLSLVSALRSTRVSAYEHRQGRWVAQGVKGRASHAVSGIELTDPSTVALLDGVQRSGRSVTLEMEPSLEMTVLDDLEERSVFTAVVAIPSRQDRRLCLVVTSARVVRGDQIAALESLGNQLSLALDGLDLAEEAHQRRSNRRFRALVENSSDVVMVVDDDGRITFASPTVRRLLGREESAVLGRPLQEFVAEDDALHIRRLLAAPSQARNSGRSSVEVRMIHGDGEYRWFEVEARDLRDDDEVGGVVITASDASERKRAEAQLMRSESRFRLMVQNSSDVVLTIDEDSLITYASPSIERMLGFSPIEVLGRNVFELLSVAEADRVRALSQADLDGLSIEVRVQGATGIVHSLEVNITDLTGQPAVEGIVLNIRDVTDRKLLEDDLRHQALHDDLTGLANRSMFTERLDDALTTRGTSAEIIGVVFVDLDDFKLINDSLGHLIGDEALVAVAQRIQECLRISDLACRLSADEFAVMLSGVYGESEILEVVERLRAAIAMPLRLGSHDLHLTASVGIATDVDSSHRAEELLRSADLAVDKAKQAGKDRSEIFVEEMQESAFAKLELKSALVRAVEQQEFLLHYQPIVDMATGRVRGVEALIRWEDPDRGMVSPAAFIPAAESNGLIHEIGLWVVEQAAHDLATWHAVGHELYVSVNVSGRQLEDQGFVDQITRRVLAAGVSPSSIVIELTESLLANGDDVVAMLARLHERGFRLALDDFGTGFSALQYLQQFEIDLIKIDRSFVQSMGQTGNTGVVQAILDVARNVEASTVAEGIEDTNEQRMLRDLGVELGQGYYFSRPVSVSKLTQMLDDERAMVGLRGSTP
jgi:diguanylate cyclase (GGDEF)-like protein/PAS domain S-box-containing protein